MRFPRRGLRILGAVALGSLLSLTVLAATTPSAQQADQRIFLGELSLVVRADPWQLVLLNPAGEVVWEEAPDQTLAYETD